MMAEGTDGCNSSCGVGQGSGSGGNLFLAFIFLKILLFIDGAQGFLHCHPYGINQEIQKSNADSNALVRWSSDHGLQLSSTKTLAIIVGFAPKLA